MSNTLNRQGQPKRPKPYVVQMAEAMKGIPIAVLPGPHRTVLLVLALACRPDGSNCYPGAATVRSIAGIGYHAWYRIVAELETARWLARADRKRPGIGGQTSNTYTLRLNGGPIVATGKRTTRGLQNKPVSSDDLAVSGVASLELRRAKTR